MIKNCWEVFPIRCFKSFDFLIFCQFLNKFLLLLSSGPKVFLPAFMRTSYLIIIVIMLFITGCIKKIENHYIFHPNKDINSTPEAWGLKYEDVAFVTEDGLTLNGWFIPGRAGADGKLHTFLWFHGNGGNIGHRLDNIKMLYDKVPANIFIFDYREFGKSEGKISEQGTYLDAKAALKYLYSREDTNNEKIIFFGRSIGSAVAVDLAVKEKCCALVLETPLTSLKDMAKSLYPYHPLGFIMQSKYDSIAKIRDIKVPVLIIHGDKDEMVPYEQGRRLYDAANSPKEFYTIPGAVHNDTYIVGGEEYFDTIGKFVSKY